MEDNIQVPHWDIESAEKGALYTSEEKGRGLEIVACHAGEKGMIQEPSASLQLKGAGGQGSQDKGQENTKGSGKRQDKLIHMDVCCRMGESQEHGKDSDRKDHVLYGSMYMQVQKR